LAPLNGTVSDFISAVRERVSLPEGGTGKIRIFEVHGNKIGKEIAETEKVASFNDFRDPPHVFAEVSMPRMTLYA
jgi:hypothetical protein